MNIEVPKAVILDNLYINVLLGRDILDTILANYGKAGWNAYVKKLRMHNIWAMYSTPEPTEDDEHCMPVCIQIKWNGVNFKDCDLSGLDLVIPEMKDCNFNGANLSGSTLGSVPESSFRDANLSGTIFDGDISGCDFSGARVTSTHFQSARYFNDSKPIHLPESRLNMCRPSPSHWDSDDDATKDEPSHSLTPKRMELRSFWGALAASS